MKLHIILFGLLEAEYEYAYAYEHEWNEVELTTK